MKITIEQARQLPKYWVVNDDFSDYVARFDNLKEAIMERRQAGVSDDLNVFEVTQGSNEGTLVEDRFIMWDRYHATEPRPLTVMDIPLPD